MNIRFALIGPGRVGSAITKALLQKGGLPVSIIGRSPAATRDACHFIGCSPDLATTDLRCAGEADLILLAVPDDSIGIIARELQQRQIPKPGTVLLHFSGAHPAAIMRYAESQTRLFSLHPLLPFADRQQAYERLNMAPYIGEGDDSARPVAETLCAALGAQLQNISPHKKPLYHAAACMASNYLVTLIAAAAELLKECGIDPERGETLLLPLLEATLENVAVRGTGNGLTGPIVRGDTRTLETHVQALKDSHTDLLDLYCLLGNKTLLLAESSGRLSTDTAKIMRKTLNENCFTNLNT